ncbi:MAG: DUF2231 domain-containing protein [Candidatus Dadabacteria bacterium]
MEKVHLHLVFNHFPIIGAFFGAIVLMAGMARKSPPTLAAGYLVLIISAIAGLITYFTGGGAAGAIKNLPGVSRPLISEHAEMALYTLICLIIVALLSIIGLFGSRNHFNRIKGVAWITLIVSVIGFGISAYTGLLGGQIRHTEVRSATMEMNAEKEHPH